MKPNTPKEKPAVVHQGKWSLPTQAEKNQRIIDSRPKFYQLNKKRWVDSFDKFNLLETFCCIKGLSALGFSSTLATWPGNFHIDKPLKLIICQKFIAASDLQGKEYNSNINSMTAYVSTKQGELPIVLDTSACFSVTPNAIEFIGKVHPCPVSSSSRLNNTVIVAGMGDIQ